MSQTLERSLKEQLRALVAEIAEKDEIPDERHVQGPRHRLDDGRRDRRGRRAPVPDQGRRRRARGFKDLEAAYALVVRKLEEKSAIAAAE